MTSKAARVGGRHIALVRGVQLVPEPYVVNRYGSRPHASNTDPRRRSPALDTGFVENVAGRVVNHVLNGKALTPQGKIWLAKAKASQ